MLKEENTLLATELKTTKERTAGEGEEAPSDKPTGEVSQVNEVNLSCQKPVMASNE